MRRVIDAVGRKAVRRALDRSSARVAAIIDQAVRDANAAVRRAYARPETDGEG